MSELWPEREPYQLPKGCKSRLAAARKNRGVSQEQMAPALGLSLATYRRLENLEMANPPVRYLINCALLLDVPLTSLIEDEWARWGKLSRRGSVKMPGPRPAASQGRPAAQPAPALESVRW